MIRVFRGPPSDFRGPNRQSLCSPASFEPTIDYVVTKIPRFTFEKFPDADATLTSAMKSVGEAMAIGRTFKESMQKALRSLEIGARGFGGGGNHRKLAYIYAKPVGNCSGNRCGA